MLDAISLKIYEMRRYLVLSLVISMIAIPFANVLVIERDRNRNEMYGEAFWIYGFSIYNMNDHQLADQMGPPFNDGYHTLPLYLGNITYEYPVFGLIFFAIGTWLFPGAGGFQPLWLNFVLTLVFNLNLVLIAVLLGDKIYNQRWARMFFAGYYVYGLIMAAGGGKLEPIVDCLMLMALVLRQEDQMGKSMFTLGLSVQTKIYSGVVLPLLFVEAPLSVIWFFVSTLLTVIPFAFLGANFDSLIQHFLNASSYSSYIVNPLFPGLFLATPGFGDYQPSYMWPPALIPLVVYVVFMLSTVHIYLPSLEDMKNATWKGRINKLKPLYLYLLPSFLFVFRWVMPWYLFWLGPLCLMFDKDEQAIGYLKQITIVGLLYTFGVFINWPYFVHQPLEDFSGHFPFGWLTFIGLGLLFAFVGIAYAIWKKEVDRRRTRDMVIQKAEERGELVL